MVSQDRRHLSITPWVHSNLFVEEGGVWFHVYSGVVDQDVQVFVSLLDHVPDELPRKINIKKHTKRVPGEYVLLYSFSNNFVQSNY